LTAGALLSQVLRTPRGSAWWRGAKDIGFVPGFAADVDAVLATAERAGGAATRAPAE
jgi:hypothetical protein